MFKTYITQVSYISDLSILSLYLYADYVVIISVDTLNPPIRKKNMV